MSPIQKSPKALIHKQILEKAEESPDLSIKTLAESVSGASPDLVQRVLDEYGDPGDGSDTKAAEEQPMPVEQDQFDPATLTDEQRETLQAVAADPTATQREIAEQLDISAATVSQRLASIDAFDWEDRGPFVAEVFDLTEDGGESVTESGESDSEPSDFTGTDEAEDAASQTSPRTDDAVEDLEERVANVETQVAELESTVEATATELAENMEQTIADGRGESAASVFDNQTLFAKVIRAVMADEAITEEEEVQVIEQLHQ